MPDGRAQTDDQPLRTLEPSPVSTLRRVQYTFRSVWMFVAAMRPDRRCNPSSARSIRSAAVLR
jgi:hypothetical protein